MCLIQLTFAVAHYSFKNPRFSTFTLSTALLYRETPVFLTPFPRIGTPKQKTVLTTVFCFGVLWWRELELYINKISPVHNFGRVRFEFKVINCYSNFFRLLPKFFFHNVCIPKAKDLYFFWGDSIWQNS